jgi:hypothetical protein
MQVVAAFTVKVAGLLFTEKEITFAPKSLYALSKLSNEIITKHLPTKVTQRIGLDFSPYMDHGEDQIWQYLEF